MDTDVNPNERRCQGKTRSLPGAQRLDGLLLAASDGNGHLNDFWFALTDAGGLRLEVFATRLTEGQAYQLVEAIFS